MLFSNRENISSSNTSGIRYLIVGLGNPDKKYENTRHNAGFMAVDSICKSVGVVCNKIKFKSLVARAEIGGHSCLLMKPTTYMNNSGQAVVEAMNFYKIPIENIIVIFDDVSLEPSKIRIRRKGSDGGHNGIKSIIYLTGKDNFPRVKLGVGKKPHPDFNLADWVLSTFKSNEQKEMQTAYENTVEIVTYIIEGKTDEAMNKYNA